MLAEGALTDGAVSVVGGCSLLSLALNLKDEGIRCIYNNYNHSYSTLANYDIVRGSCDGGTRRGFVGGNHI